MTPGPARASRSAASATRPSSSPPTGSRPRPRLIEKMPVSQRRVTVNLSPAGERKVGTGFDLAIFVAVAAAMELVPRSRSCATSCTSARSASTGTVRAVPGVLPLVRAAAMAGVRHVVVPVANAGEARLVSGVQVHPVADVPELVRRYDALGQGHAASRRCRCRPSLPPPPEPGARPQRGRRSGRRQARPRDRGRRRSPPAARRAARAPARRCWPSGCRDCCRRSARPSRWRSRRSTRCSAPSGPAQDVAAHLEAPLRRAPPRRLAGRGHRWRQRPHPPRRHHPGPPRRPLPRRDAGVRQGRAPVAAHAARARDGLHRPRPGDRHVPVALPARPRRQPVPVRQRLGQGPRLHVHPAHAPVLLRQAERPAARPRRPPGPRASLRGSRWPGRHPGESTAAVAARVAAARDAQGERWRAVLGRRRGVNADVPGSVLRGRPWRLPTSATTTLDRALERGALSLRGYDRTLRCAWTIADVMGLQRPGRASRSTWRCHCATGPGRRHEGGLHRTVGLPPVAPRSARRGCQVDADRFARAALSRLAEPCDKEVPGLVDELGAVETLGRIRAGRGTLARFAGATRRRSTPSATSTSPRRWALASSCPATTSGPSRLSEIPVPPYCLWVRGPLDLAETVERSVAIVGSRTATGYGEQVAADLARRLSPSGGGPSCRARRSASTAARTAAPWPSTAPRSPCSPAASSGPTPRRTQPSSRASPATGSSSPRWLPGRHR